MLRISISASVGRGFCFRGLMGKSIYYENIRMSTNRVAPRFGLCLAKRLSMRFLPIVLVILLAAGCLKNEETEIRILREGGEPSVIVVEQVNLYSDQTDAKKIREDFDQLIKDWRGDDKVKDSAKAGLFVKRGELFVREGRIVRRDSGSVLNLAATNLSFQVDDTRI